jgi:pimeloyl-ACP methyl ester carboxylesterase
MASKKKGLEIAARGPERGGEKAAAGQRAHDHPRDASGRIVVSGRWLLGAVAIVIVAAVFCVWCGLCLLFWQGSWQLLYHPATVVARTPSTAGLAFDAVGFAATDAGTPRLAGWWIAAAPDAKLSRLTVLYLHGQDGNLGDTVDALSRLHAAGVNVLAFDYRGYGQSQFVRPSEAHWRQDAEWAIAYLTGTRHVAPGTIVLDGAGLGANLALEVAAAHPELAGVIVERPIPDPMSAIFSDARARMVPAHLLVRDRYDTMAPARALQIPSLLLLPPSDHNDWSIVHGPLQDLVLKSRVKGLGIIDSEDGDFEHMLRRWLAHLPTR